MKNELAKSKEDITSAYTAAITSAINTLDGKLTEKVNAEISKINERIDNEVTALKQKLSALDDRIGALEVNIESVKSELKAMQDEISALKDQISKIVNKVISISYVPTYEDGYEVVPYTMDGSTIVPGDFTLKFEVAPASAAEEIASVWQSALSAKAVYTLKTKAAGDFVPLTIKSATGKDGILSLAISGKGISDGFFNKLISMSVRLKISNSSNEILSEYVKCIIPSDSYVEKNVNYGHGVNIDGVVWAPVNVGETWSDKFGKLYLSGVAKTVCPTGWRLPTGKELVSLISNYSDFTTYNGVKGRWFSGSENWSNEVPSIFLPASGHLDKDNKPEYKETIGWYWSSTMRTIYTYFLRFDERSVDYSSTNGTAYYSVRCVKE